MTSDAWLFEMRNKLPLCGCGNPADALLLVRKILSALDDPIHKVNFAGLREAVPGTGARMLILGSLTEANLIEHGGGIDGSWLTEDGSRFLTAMRAAFAEGDEDAADEWIENISRLEVR